MVPILFFLPEMPYDINSVVNAIEKRGKAGKRFTIIAVAEACNFKRRCSTLKERIKEKKQRRNILLLHMNLAEKIQEKDR